MKPFKLTDTRSLLPMTIVDNDDQVIEEIICSSISGGANYVEGMPKELTLMRVRDGMAIHWARYEFVGPVDPPISDKDQD
jgi:hypothetical protein